MSRVSLTYLEIVAIGRRLAAMPRAEVHGLELELREYVHDESQSPRELQAFHLLVEMLAQVGR